MCPFRSKLRTRTLNTLRTQLLSNNGVRQPNGKGVQLPTSPPCILLLFGALLPLLLLQATGCRQPSLDSAVKGSHSCFLSPLLPLYPSVTPDKWLSFPAPFCYKILSISVIFLSPVLSEATTVMLLTALRPWNPNCMSPNLALWLISGELLPSSEPAFPLLPQYRGHDPLLLRLDLQLLSSGSLDACVLLASQHCPLMGTVCHKKHNFKGEYNKTQGISETIPSCLFSNPSSSPHRLSAGCCHPDSTPIPRVLSAPPTAYIQTPPSILMFKLMGLSPVWSRWSPCYPQYSEVMLTADKYKGLCWDSDAPFGR